MGFGRLLAEVAGKGAEYELLERFRELPHQRQQEIITYGKGLYEKWGGGLLPPGPMSERELYRLYMALPSELQQRIRRKGERVHRAWVKAGRPSA